jgi:hypothetical protein
MEKEFKKEFIEKYSLREYNEIQKIIDHALSCNIYKDKLIDGDIWSINQDVEKHNALQYTHYIYLYKESDNKYDEEITMEYENGINNGTVLRSYCLEGGSIAPAFRTIEVLEDLELDWDEVVKNFQFKNNTNEEPIKEIAEIIFKREKPKIMKVYSNQNYDNYVTGGGTNIINKAYKYKFQYFHDKGLFWILKYKKVQADINYI